MERLDNLAASLVAMAVSLVGDVASVRKAMACSESDFEAFCTGSKAPSQDEFERLVELIVREQGNLIAAKRELLAQLRDKGKPPSG